MKLSILTSLAILSFSTAAHAGYFQLVCGATQNQGHGYKPVPDSEKRIDIPLNKKNGTRLDTSFKTASGDEVKITGVGMVIIEGERRSPMVERIASLYVSVEFPRWNLTLQDTHAALTDIPDNFVAGSVASAGMPFSIGANPGEFYGAYCRIEKLN